MLHLKKVYNPFQSSASSPFPSVPQKYVMDLSCSCLVLYFKHLVEIAKVEGISRVITT